jgi:hypothetical protein
LASGLVETIDELKERERERSRKYNRRVDESEKSWEK